MFNLTGDRRSDDEIDQCKADRLLQRQAQHVADAFARAYNAKHKTNIAVPVKLTYGLEFENPKAGGTAWPDHVQLNMVLFRDNAKEFFNSVIPHEMAHLAQFSRAARERIKNAGGGHGWLWVELMKSMRQRPLQFHAMDTKKAIAAFKKYHKEAKAAK